MVHKIRRQRTVPSTQDLFQQEEQEKAAARAGLLGIRMPKANRKRKLVDNMKELRDIKIDMLTGSQNPVIDLFNQITCGIEIICRDVYEKHGLEFIYHKDGEWIFYQDCKNEKFWAHYYRYWSPFESKLGLEYLEIQSITKYLVEEALKREVSTPPSNITGGGFGVEEALKREVSTPEYSFESYVESYHTEVEEALMRNL